MAAAMTLGERAIIDTHGAGHSGELVVAVVAPVGTETEKVWRSIRAILDSYGYAHHLLKLSWFFDEERTASYLDFTIQKGSEYDRLSTSMNAGDELRKKTSLKEAMALVACSYIHQKRREAVSEEGIAAPVAEEVDDGAGAEDAVPTKKPLRRVAHLLHSIKRPEEVVYLRRVYGGRFLLVSVYVPRSERIRNPSTGACRNRKRSHWS